MAHLCANYRCYVQFDAAQPVRAVFSIAFLICLELQVRRGCDPGVSIVRATSVGAATGKKGGKTHGRSSVPAGFSRTWSLAPTVSMMRRGPRAGSATLG